MKRLVPLFLFAIASCCSACLTTNGVIGQLNWAFSCDFPGSTYASVTHTPGHLCGHLCISDDRCTHFSWVDVHGGTCYLKQNRRDREEIENAFSYRFRTGPTWICGTVENRINRQIYCPFNGGNGAEVIYDLSCDYFGSNIASFDGRGEDCGDECLNNRHCTHFTWFNNKCYLKRASKSRRRASFRRLNGAICGYVESHVH